MSYQVLSLKWRPKTFSEIEGQEPIQKILTQAVQKNSLHPALIFSGTKGTGKTSTARIVAKSLRCERKKTYEPCNQCSSCVEVNEGSSLNVLEIDGASHNGVDAIRNLKDSIQYMPSFGSKKIYIIDEVHMLSQSAFNALLKTLEEPPAHVVFIMATTELRKIPTTVLSRCQIFHFRPILAPLIQKRLKQICQAEKIQIEDEALWLIVEQSQQSMRDAQVLLDQMASFGNKKITSDMIIHLLGLHHRSLLNSLLKAIVERDTKSVLQFMPQLSSLNPEVFLNTLLVQMRNLLMIQITKKPSWIFLMEKEMEFLKKLCQNTTSEELHFLFDMCLKGREDLKKSFDPHITLEMVLLRMSQAPRIESLFTRSDNSKNSLVSKKNKSTEKQNLSPTPAPIKKEESQPVLKNPSEEKTFSLSTKKDSLEEQTLLNEMDKNSSVSKKNKSTEKQNLSPTPAPIKKEESPPVLKNSNSTMSMNQWKKFIKFIYAKDVRLAALIKSYSFCEGTSSEIILGYPESQIFLEEKTKDLEFRNQIEAYVTEFLKSPVKCRFIPHTSDSVRTQEEVSNQKIKAQKLKKAQAHPLAKKVSRFFQTEALSLDKPPSPK